MIELSLAESFRAGFKAVSARIVLDIDDTDEAVHGGWRDGRKGAGPIALPTSFISGDNGPRGGLC